MHRSLGLSFLTLLIFAAFAYASSGDRAQSFQSCIVKCESRTCPYTHATPLLDRLTFWTCADACKYRCMHYLTDFAIQAGTSIEQYYGKWPFWRKGGMQEPASVMFSVLNGLFHWWGVERLRNRVPVGHPMKKYYLRFAMVSINAWVWSSVFHTRDLPFTEKMDYFSAALAIMYAFYYTVVRLFHLYTPATTPQINPSPRHIVRRFLAFVCAGAFLAHVTYLTFLPRFDYSYNMIANLIVGMAHNILWLLYSLPASLSVLHRFPGRPKSYRPSYASKAALFVVLTTAATALELFDFPPWGRYIDAHALWHLSTVPIIPFWYEFLIQDARDDGWKPRL
ncbi:hypothetical protein NM688_g6509 [Phlebia brevispora]|uniref:Uncharacterized protein n=1 Tax=Phlebia brevispora TaxID=194682 RepID=A0ACC1SF90_9APHY|nr:hypothetical protein NM688_g6509 [Phlebia brevispora]